MQPFTEEQEIAIRSEFQRKIDEIQMKTVEDRDWAVGQLITNQKETDFERGSYCGHIEAWEHVIESIRRAVKHYDIINVIYNSEGALPTDSSTT